MTDFLNLPNLRLVQPAVEDETQYTVLAETITPTPQRPCCLFFKNRNKRNGTKRQVIHDMPAHGKHVVIFIDRQRWKCLECGKTVYEALPFVDDDHLMTTRLANWAYQRSWSRPFTEIGDDIGVDEGTVRKMFKRRSGVEIDKLNIVTPRVLGIDAPDQTYGADLATLHTAIREGRFWD